MIRPTWGVSQEGPAKVDRRKAGTDSQVEKLSKRQFATDDDKSKIEVTTDDWAAPTRLALLFVGSLILLGLLLKCWFCSLFSVFSLKVSSFRFRSHPF